MDTEQLVVNMNQQQFWGNKGYTLTKRELGSAGRTLRSAPGVCDVPDVLLLLLDCCSSCEMVLKMFGPSYSPSLSNELERVSLLLWLQERERSIQIIHPFAD